MKKLLIALGYEETIVIEKTRRIWQLGNCVIALDELPLLGKFVEIEGPDEEQITGLQSNLGLADLPHISQGYLQLMKLNRSDQ